MSEGTPFCSEIPAQRDPSLRANPHELPNLARQLNKHSLKFHVSKQLWCSLNLLMVGAAAARPVCQGTRGAGSPVTGCYDVPGTSKL